jgi:putative DNA primase/helicase
LNELADDFAAQDRADADSAQYVEKKGRLFTTTGQPVVRWKDGDLPMVVDLAETALIESGIKIFQRDSPLTLVRLMQRPAQSVRNYKRPPGVLGMVTVDLPYLLETLTRVAVWERFDARAKEWRRINCPEKVVSTLLSRGGEWKMPRISGAITAPTLRPDGTILQQPGYDAATHVYYDPCGVDYPPIPENPGYDDAHRAFDTLRAAFGSFPYQEPVDEAAALSYALTALVRRSLPAAPLGAISAPKPGSGKSLLADCIGILAMGTAAPAMTFSSTDEEAQKTALSVLMQGDPVILIDNVERPLEGDWLCSILTQEVYTQRALGRNEMVTVPTRTLILATGNHLSVAGDLRTRTLLCRIDAKLERPEQRAYDYDLRIKTLANRPAIVAAGLTLMRAFVTTQQRPADFVRPWGRFEHWSDLVRAPLVWMDCEDPCESLKTIERDDPMRSEHLQVMLLWHRAFGDRKLTAREVVTNMGDAHVSTDLVALNTVLRELVLDKTGVLSSRRLGKWLERNKDAPVGMTLEREGRIQYQVERAGEQDNAALWRVVKRAG